MSYSILLPKNSFWMVDSALSQLMQHNQSIHDRIVIYRDDGKIEFKDLIA